MPAANIRTVAAGPFAWVILDRPERRNALDTAALRAFVDEVGRLTAEPGVAAIGLRGEGGHFCSGADIDELAGLTSLAAHEYARLGQAACYALEQAPVPVVAAVRGYCVGGGLELAMSCDVRLAHPDARFGQVELGIGSIPAWGGIRRLPRLVGVDVAKDLVFTGRHVDASTAVGLGLVSRLVGNGEVEAVAEGIGQRVARAPRRALAASKRGIDQWVDVPLEAGLEQDRETFALLVEGEEFRDGVRRFRERSDSTSRE